MGASEVISRAPIWNWNGVWLTSLTGHMPEFLLAMHRSVTALLPPPHMLVFSLPLGLCLPDVLVTGPQSPLLGGIWARF